ncbi:MAG: TetR family transcriptional regulator [Frankiales bacterium]|nr:TetR family transcriptional regulator [Frankiales bacterium]
MSETPTVVTSESQLRLNRALVEHLATLTVESLDEVRIDLVAERAGVSRSTAYRHFGDREALLRQAALEIGRQHAELISTKIADAPTIAAKIEETFANTAKGAKVSRLLRLLDMSRDRAQAHTAVLQELSLEIMGPEYAKAQADGELRTDLTVAEIVSWLASQREVMLRLELDEAAARVWVQRFVCPVLRPEAAEGTTAPEIVATLAEVDRRVERLRELVHRTRASLPLR